MRIATFNLENLDLPPKVHVTLEVQGEILRPALAKLDEYGHEHGENLARIAGRALVAIQHRLEQLAYLGEGIRLRVDGGNDVVGLLEVVRDLSSAFSCSASRARSSSALRFAI